MVFLEVSVRESSIIKHTLSGIHTPCKYEKKKNHRQETVKERKKKVLGCAADL